MLQRVEQLAGRPLRQALPQLELIIHGGTSLAPYAEEFRRLFPSGGPRLLELLPSSEAFMGFQVQGEDGMRLTPYYGAFFEFVPIAQLDESGSPPPEVLLVEEQLIYDWSREVRSKLGGQSKIPHIDPTLTGEQVASLSAYRAV